MVDLAAVALSSFLVAVLVSSLVQGQYDKAREPLIAVRSVAFRASYVAFQLLWHASDSQSLVSIWT